MPGARTHETGCDFREIVVFCDKLVERRLLEGFRVVHGKWKEVGFFVGRCETKEWETVDRVGASDAFELC